MDFKYRTTFTSKASILHRERKDFESFSAFASAARDISALSGLLPSKEEIDKNPDLLYVSFNLAVANQANLNDDAVLTADIIEMSKNIKYKQLNIEHNRDEVVGCLTSASFSSYADSKLMNEKEVEGLTTPFNLAASAVIWRVVGDIDRIVEECANPDSPHYFSISTSFEVGFQSYKIALNSRNLAYASIIEDEKEIESLSKYLRCNGGKGITPDGQSVYRVISNPTILGAGLVLQPAADVKGILTYKSDMQMQEPEMEMEEPEIEEPETEIEDPEMEDEDEEEGKKMVKIELEIEVSAAEKVLNKPFRLPSGSKKKFGVYVKNDKGNVVTVKFGDPNMEIKRDDPDRRKAYRSRHGCDVNPGPKWKANYWSCKMWSGEPVSEIVASVEEDMMDLKEDLAEMVIGSISVIQKHAESILAYANDPVVKENLSEPFLQGMAALAEDYVSTIHNYAMYSEESSEMEDDMPEMEDDMEDVEGARPGLWENIREKKRKMGKNYRPARPGTKDYPDKDAYKKAQGDEYEWDGKEEFSQAELLRIDPMLALAKQMKESYSEKNIKKSENKISSFNKPIVTPINQPMKITDLKSAIAAIEGVDSEAFASKAVCDFITSEIAKANELYVAEQTLKAETEASLAAALSDATEAKAKFEELSTRLAEVEAQAAAQAAQDIFDARFTSLAEIYNLEDSKLRSLIAKQIRDLDEAAFESWKQDDGLVILAGKEKEKTPVNIEQATELMKEAKASVEDLPNAQDLADKPKFNILDLSDLIEIKA
jgi:hypothetical protein